MQKAKSEKKQKYNKKSLSLFQSINMTARTSTFKRKGQKWQVSYVPHDRFPLMVLWGAHASSEEVICLLTRCVHTDIAAFLFLGKK